MNWLRKHKNTILLVTVLGFVGSMFVGFGLYMRQSGPAMDVVAEVNDDKIPYQDYLTLYTRVAASKRDQKENLTPEAINGIKKDVIQSLIQESVFYQEALRYGMKVTDAELAQSLASIPAFQKDGKFSPQVYMEALHYALRTTPEQFETTQMKQIAISRLRAFVLQGVKITEPELQMEYFERAAKEGKRKTQADFVKDRAAFFEQLRQEKGAQVLNRWYAQIGTNLKVKVHLEEIEKRRPS